ncbi:Hypothetical predicted protein [Cloeon dipterum]|uniref:Caspase family p20 domain-containing protein n=1 Tax=Cloeon dipterum TaxID=197152 RepID=A0A8S1DDA2_9INSE|nr:Hypothetical predicted protein [Cloeon dipterum]
MQTKLNEAETLLILPNKKVRSIGYWDGDESKVVRTACVLLINYSYSNDCGKERTAAVEADKKQIRDAFSGLKVGIYVTSEPLKDILAYLSKEKKIREKFQLLEHQTPELFFVFISTHGGKNGIIRTHHKESVEVSEVYYQLHNNPLLSKTLKLIFVSACRGTIHDEMLLGEKYCKCGKKLMLRQKVLRGKDITLDTQRNIDAVRVIQEDIRQDDDDPLNFVIMFASVDTTLALRNDAGTHLFQAFCKTLNNLEKDVGLEEFLTRCMCNQHFEQNLQKGCGSTPEVKVFSHRQFTFSRRAKAQFRKKSSLLKFNYDWKSDVEIPLLTRKAYVYATPRHRDSKQIQKLQNNLKGIFGFEVHSPSSFEEIKKLGRLILFNLNNDPYLFNAVSDEEEELEGCVLVCVVAPIYYSKQSNELITSIYGERTPIKRVIYSAVYPSTKKWIGKPKIFVFLHADDRENDLKTQGFLDLKKTEFTRTDTLHSGLLTVILPQTDSVQLFTETLEEFAKPGSIEESTFQQFFFTLLRRAKEENKVSPLVISTLGKRLSMKFPVDLFIDSFTLLTPTRKEISFNDLEQKLGLAVEDANVKSKALYCVPIITAESGTGKSKLAETLAARALTRNQKLVTFVDIKEENQFLEEFDWKMGYRWFVEKFAKMKGAPRTFGANEFIILDGFEQVQEEYKDGMLGMIRSLAREKIPLLILTRPGNDIALIECLKGIRPMLIIAKINEISKINQIVFLHEKLGMTVKLKVIREIVSNIVSAGAGDLIERIGTLEKVATFQQLRSGPEINIYELSEHVFESTVASVLAKSGFLEGHLAHRDEREKVQLLTEYAHDFFFSHREQRKKDETLADYGIFRFTHCGGVTISITLAAYLLVRNKISDGEISEIPKSKEKKLLKTMKQHREIMLKKKLFGPK